MSQCLKNSFCFFVLFLKDYLFERMRERERERESVCVCVCVCVMEYYLAIKKNEVLPFATMWVELEGIMLREISKSEKDNYHVISLIHGV